MSLRGNEARIYQKQEKKISKAVRGVLYAEGREQQEVGGEKDEL